MIRTNVVTLTVIDAVAYRQKLTAGGSGIVILRNGVSQPGIASISKTSGDPIPTANTPKDSYPLEAFKEAMELTKGMPYRKLGAVKYVETPVVEEEPVAEEVVIDTNEYQSVVDAYTDKKDKLSYDLLNRDLIKFAHSSSKVRTMIANKESVETIKTYVVGMKFRNITDNHDLTDDQIAKMIEMLDEVSPKSVLKEFTEEIRKQLKK